MFWLMMGLLSLLVASVMLAHGRHRRLARRLRRFESTLALTEARADRTERRLYERLMTDALALRGRAPRLPLALTSQFGEDVFLWELFGPDFTGTYLEVGAFDGKTISSTYALEALGWSGLLVEPLPERFEQCRVNRPHSHVVHAAVAGPGSTGTITFLRVVGDEGKLSDLASTADTGEQHRDYLALSGARTEKVQAPLTSLAALLESWPGFPGTLDVAVIDVEGSEAEALRGLDLHRFRPRVVIMEDLADQGKHARTAAAETLINAGYTEVAPLGHNRVFIRTDETALLERARMLGQGGAVRGGN